MVSLRDDKIVVITTDEFHLSDYSNACYFPTISDACECIEANYLYRNNEDLCVIQIREDLTGTYYDLKAEYSYDGGSDSYQLVETN